MDTIPGTAPGPLPDAGRSAAQGAEPASGQAVPGFDAVARFASHALDVPLVALVLVDGSAYWYLAAASGHLPAGGAPAPACLAAARGGEPTLTLDTHDDPRFLPPAATDEPVAPVRFFASEPVFALDGRLLGALCAMDHKPRAVLDEVQRDALRDAAALTANGVALRAYLGRIDPTTRLPHRGAFFADLGAHLRTDADTVWLAAIEVAPVARFHAFMRAMGHAYADALMRAVAARVQAWAGTDIQLYQVGASRLAAMLPEPHESLPADRLDDLVALLRAPVDCLGIPLTLQPGVGLLRVAAHELRGGDPLRLVMSASHAAQDSSRGWAVYERTQDERHRQEFFLVTELAAALTERAELELYYQPRVALDSGRCVALEALARWRHPTVGEVLPSVFVALAEQAGLMRALTDWVLDHGLAQLAAWRREGLDVKLSLNVSSADLDATLAPRLQAAATRHGVQPSMVELEFTESTLMRHCDATRRYLAELRELGAGVAIDDFGIGYSNLAALRQMPAGSLKIDQSLVRGMDARPHDATIVRSVAALAHELGFRVVIEGVESARIYAAVQGMACDEAQGYHISRPLPAALVVGWLRLHATPPAPRDDARPG